ncbi:MAG: hypothetical protein ACHQ53_03145, partial [Polyangiales bacterium]
LQRYFEYGRSTEGKLRWQIRRDTHTSLLAQVGLLAAPTDQPQPERAQQGHMLVAGYGQSFTGHILSAAAEMDPRIEPRLLGGPGAPLSHSFKLYEQDRHKHEASIVVLGVLASSLPMLMTLTTMTYAFEHPAPYTYPRYSMRHGRLDELDPHITSLTEFRSALADDARFRAFRAQLEAHDEAFDPWVFDAGPLDYSLIGRCMRRALGQRSQHRFLERFHTAGGFTNAGGLLDTADALLAEFARTARADGKQPFVLLFNDRGYRDDLYRALGPRLQAHGIEFLSSHELAPPSDARTFIPDGHFRPELDRALAAEFLRRLALSR